MAPSPERATPDYIHTLGEFAAQVTIENVGERASAHALRVVRDTLGCIIAGANVPEVAALIGAAPQLSGSGNASAVGRGAGVSPQTAAMINAMAGVSLELDEGCPFSTNHPAVHILPAALAIAEAQSASGENFLDAFIAGYEVACWIGHASRLRASVHPFGTHAITGAAVACARLMGADARGISKAIELAAGMALASSQTAANAGAGVRNAVTGLTAHNGVLAAILSRAGITAEPDAARVVFGSILGEAFDITRPGFSPGKDLYLLRNYFKVHACSRWNHAPIEAVIAAMAKHPIVPQDIARIVVYTFDPAIRLAWKDPSNPFAAKHSIPFNVAVRLLRNSNGIEAYTTETVQNPEIRALAARVDVREDPAYTRLVPATRPARVEITMADGTRVTGSCDNPPGGTDRPFPTEVLTEKFRQLAALGLAATDVDKLQSLVAGLASAPSVAPIGELLRHVSTRQS